MSTSDPALQAPAPGLVARVANWSAAHRRLVIVGWIVLLFVSLGLSGAVGTNFANNFSLPGTDSQRAVDLLKADFPAQAGDADQVVFATSQGSVTDAATRTRIEPALKQIAAVPDVTAVVSPYSAAGAKQISKSGDVAFATVDFNKQAGQLPKASVQKVIDVAEAAGSPTLQVALGGQAIEQAQRQSIGAATAVGLLAAIIVLLITFGSFAAMGLPILTALLGLGTGIGLAGLASQVIDMPNFATELAAMIGLGVGIDYALFIVTRFRENYASGLDVQESTSAALDTAGRAVLFAGITVIIALLGQFLLGVGFLYGLAVASALAVLMTMFAALTVLPALLSRFGERMGGKARVRAQQSSGPGVWLRWAGFIERHRWVGMVAGLAIMLTLAAPVLALRLGSSDAGNDPSGQTTRHAYDLLAKGFGPGFNGPLLVVAKLPHAGDTAALTAIADTLRTTPNVVTVSPPRLAPAGGTAVFNVYPGSSPESLASSELVTSLRNDTLPPLAHSTGTTLLVGGAAATGNDFTHVLSSKLPLFIGVVVLLSALLLMIVFRSLVIPLQAAVMNLLTIGAALGVVVAIFQWGWLGGLFNVKPGPIDSFIPVMLFAIVFGLSMDYEVFLVSRIHEEWSRTHNAAAAVRAGVGSTGRVITAAATIMICVFLSFVFGGSRVIELFGLSLASAVFLDAFVVRILLLPSVLYVLGARTWALPRWLEDHLPHIAVERAPTEHVPVPEPAPRLEPALDSQG